MGNGKVILAISTGAFKATPIGFRLPKDKVPFDEWEALGEQLRMVQGAVQWAIGDWMNYGDEKFGEMAPQAWNIWPEYSYDQLRKFARVAQYIPLEERRPHISWSMHSEVAPLSKTDRNKWLDALEKGLTRADLRLSLNGKVPKKTHACPECGASHVVQETLPR